jgi:hypothetical protein
VIEKEIMTEVGTGIEVIVKEIEISEIVIERV